MESLCLYLTGPEFTKEYYSDWARVHNGILLTIRLRVTKKIKTKTSFNRGCNYKIL